MGPFIGFLVLLGPLVFVVLWLPFCLWIARNVAKRFTGSGARWASGAAAFFVALLLPFADSIAGRIYFNHLCSTEAGVKVYQTVELPAEYWDAQGKPRFLAANGFVDMKLLPNRFEWRNVDEPYVDSPIKIEKSRWKLIDKETQNILGERITYMRHFGWLNRFSAVPNIGESCRDSAGEFNRNELLRKEREQDQMFFLGIFKPAISAR